MADIKSESVADFTSESLAGLLWNQHRKRKTAQRTNFPGGRARKELCTYTALLGMTGLD